MITEVPSNLAFLDRPTWEGESGTVIAALSPTVPDNLLAIQLVRSQRRGWGSGVGAWECGLPEGAEQELTSQDWLDLASRGGEEARATSCQPEEML